ncbi:unnamed protein product [Mycena citricolor]|uniref:Uncharacterized protein n=1 Tax=Mycena citricolor TaxID=2018698 RepID=A0AAD2HPS0_9AGAR|nr:unnamed protein product [Mycena citricolor]CAK5277892.1 unnamed protein product [Mycena citricolor]
MRANFLGFLKHILNLLDIRIFIPRCALSQRMEMRSDHRPSRIYLSAKGKEQCDDIPPRWIERHPSPRIVGLCLAIIRVPRHREVERQQEDRPGRGPRRSPSQPPRDHIRSGIGVRACAEQERDNRRVAALDCMGKRVAVGAPLLETGSACHEHLGPLQIPDIRGVVDDCFRGAVKKVLGVDVRPVVQQQTHRVPIVVIRGEEQRRLVLIVITRK